MSCEDATVKTMQLPRCRSYLHRSAPKSDCGELLEPNQMLLPC